MQRSVASNSSSSSSSRRNSTNNEKRNYVIVGTYEGGIVGWRIDEKKEKEVGKNRGQKNLINNHTKKRKFDEIKEDEGEKEFELKSAEERDGEDEENQLIPSSLYRLKQVFGYCSHQGSVRTVATPMTGNKQGCLLASGGSDEYIKIYNVEQGREAGELSHHKGTINVLEFVNSQFLLCGSEDGVISIWRIHDWTLHHLLGGHKGGITGLAIHPSGRLALSTSKDRTLRLWNLIDGRCGYITRLHGIGEHLSWSLDGSKYAYCVGSTICIENMISTTKTNVKDTGNPNASASTHCLELRNTRPVTLLWLTDDILAMSSENNQILIFSLNNEDKEIAQNQELPYLIDRISTASFCKRIKTMCREPSDNDNYNKINNKNAITNHYNQNKNRLQLLWWIGSSDGQVILLEYDYMKRGKLKKVAATSAGEDTRILCITRCIDEENKVQAGSIITNKVLKRYRQSLADKAKQDIIHKAKTKLSPVSSQSHSIAVSITEKNEIKRKSKSSIEREKTASTISKKNMDDSRSIAHSNRIENTIERKTKKLKSSKKTMSQKNSSQKNKK